MTKPKNQNPSKKRKIFLENTEFIEVLVLIYSLYSEAALLQNLLTTQISVTRCVTTHLGKTIVENLRTKAELKGPQLFVS